MKWSITYTLSQLQWWKYHILFFCHKGSPKNDLFTVRLTMWGLAPLMVCLTVERPFFEDSPYKLWMSNISFNSRSWRTRGRRCTRRWWHCSNSRPGLPPPWNHNQSRQGRGAPIKDKLFEEHFPWKSSKIALTGSKISAILSLTLYQALAAPTRSFCPRASSRSNKGIPTTSSITRNGMMNAPEKAHFRFLSGTHP